MVFYLSNLVFMCFQFLISTDDFVGISNQGSKQHDGNSSPAKVNLSLNGIFANKNGSQEGKEHIVSQVDQADENATVNKNDADVQTIMLPKLGTRNIITPIDELEAKEKAEPGFCRQVKEFVVGRHGCGSIKFSGETDATNLELEFLVQFKHREVIVYNDENKKPPFGEGLKKPAKITLPM